MLNYLQSGQGDPVVLLHAYPLDLHMWDAQREALATAGHRVITPDLPGFGDSPLDTSTLPDLALPALAVLNLLDALGIDEFALGGLSMGGYVAMEILRQAPDRVSQLMLVDTKATPDGPEAQAGREQTAQAALAAGSLVPLTDGMLGGLLGATTRAQSPAVLERTKEWIAAAKTDACAWAMRAMARRPDSLPTLAAFDRPALVLAGTEDVLSPPGEQELMVAALPEGQLVMLPGSGHLSAIEVPSEVSDALLDFLG